MHIASARFPLAALPSAERAVGEPGGILVDAMALRGLGCTVQILGVGCTTGAMVHEQTPLTLPPPGRWLVASVSPATPVPLSETGRR